MFGLKFRYLYGALRISVKFSGESSKKSQTTDPVRLNPHSFLYRITSSHPPMQIDLLYPIQS
ncbi:hypothetical protein BT96DRAFT_919141 [Gymnopus androsaceus JB14]|uniref:Uncharacterized protein n=1 Tax=Gymnopus androsaceus JB14 TaxID=1447944 RepID=A0A6A4HTA7_9AGAR|nr:hypothetical protein BT96DRAFT_919141 [Gymnopus androsaceus JB14]